MKEDERPGRIVVVNLDAGGRPPLLEPGSRVRRVRSAELEAALEAALAARPDVLGVAGGDGTLRAAADLAAGGPTAIAPIPAGTLNHFARRLGIATTAAAAPRTLRRTRVPIGIVDDTVFLNTATFGAYADIVRQRDRLGRGRARWLAAALAAVVAVRRLAWHDIEIVLPDGTILRRRTPLVWVRAPETVDEPALLEIIIFHLAGRLDAARLMLRMMPHLAEDRLPADDPRVEVVRTRSVLLRSDARLGVTLDGEPTSRTPPFWIAVQDGALAVALPVP